MAKNLGRPKAEWQRTILDLLQKHSDSIISLSQLEQVVDTDRYNVSRTLTRIVQSKKESVYQTQELQEALKKKLEGENN